MTFRKERTVFHGKVDKTNGIIVFDVSIHTKQRQHILIHRIKLRLFLLLFSIRELDCCACIISNVFFSLIFSVYRNYDINNNISNKALDFSFVSVCVFLFIYLIRPLIGVAMRDKLTGNFHKFAFFLFKRFIESSHDILIHLSDLFGSFWFRRRINMVSIWFQCTKFGE